MVVSFLVMFVVVYILFATAMNSLLSEREMESMHSQTDIERNMLISSMEYIPNITKEWALLPSVYTYVNGESDLFYQEHLTSENALKLYKLNLLTVLTSSNEVKSEKYYRYVDERIAVNPTDLREIYAEFNEACRENYEHAKAEGLLDTTSLGINGYVSQNGFVYYLSAHPIIDENAEDPVAGTLIFGRLIDEEELYGVTRAETSRFTVISRDNVKLSSEESRQLEEEGFIVQSDGETLTSYAILGSTLDRPDILVRDKSDRLIYEEGQGFIWMIIGLMAVGCLIALFIIMNLMNRIVVRPTTTLVGEVHKLDAENKNNRVSENVKSLEISDLAHSINLMMEKIDENRQTIEKKNETLYHNANYDSLTGLRNRFNFEDELKKRTAATQKEQRNLCVFFMDVDRLKYINDTFGHPLGDGLIKAIAQRLDFRFSNNNIVARMSGDEFAICSFYCQNKEEMDEFGNQILYVFSEPFHVEGIVIEVTASLGSSVCPDDGTDGVTLIKKAEMAMYHAKGKGKGLYAPYRKDFHEVFQRQVHIESKLRAAIQAGCNEFELYFQPKLEVREGGIEHCEALIRWNAPEGMIFPDEFIPAAEDSGLIIPLTWWIIEKSYHCARLLRDKGHPTAISINVPPQVVMHEELLDRLTKTAEKEKMEPNVINIEVTERTLLDEPQLVKEAFKNLQRKNIEISVDDFGTGYSSLSYLNRLPINRLKIDRSFVRNINEETDGRTIVLAIIAMAKNLGILTTAEGVEDGLQYWFFKMAGCEEIQGYIVSKPVSFDEYLRFIEAWDFIEFENGLNKPAILSGLS